MKRPPLLLAILGIVCLALPACHQHDEDAEEHGHNKIVVTSPQVRDVELTQQYVCQIHAWRHIEVCALDNGYLKEIAIKEGQTVEKGEVMFRILPILYKTELDTELAELQFAKVEYENSKRLADEKVISLRELALFHAKLLRAQAKAKVAEAKLSFTNVEAPFSGIVDKQRKQLGSLIKEGEILTTLSDNSLMWVYFNVPERNYLTYKRAAERVSGPTPRDSKVPEGNNPAHKNREEKSEGPEKLKLLDSRIELKLADGSKFDYDAGDTVTVEAKFNNETGTVFFRADFPNPDGLLRHGMTGNIVIRQRLRDALVIPQRATFEILDRRYVYVINSEDGLVRQREITIQHELDDVYVLKPQTSRNGVKIGLSVDDKFIFEGVRQVHDGDRVEFEFRPPAQILKDQRFPAE